MSELSMMKQGFTLMEIMIVMILMGILVTLGVASFKSARQKGNDLRRKSDLASIAKALEAYASDHDGYPADDGNGNMRACDYGSGVATCNWNGEWKDDKGTYYMVLLPTDPSGTAQRYFYDNDPLTGSFQLYTLLENTRDVDLKRVAGVVQYYDTTVCGTAKRCNYGVSSTNISVTTGHSYVPNP